ncbi:hypothetical protein [Paenibacillus cremeus]|uniref:hypothetical protein n=1 Tax=Paenibacillus cremeus TaxID=2163881 RepID=UPI0016482027|nr:hypothetical protein [Paenibacillus cremeus]
MLTAMEIKALLCLGAAEMARGIREGRWTSQALVEAHIERMMEVNPTLNAMATAL